MYVLKMKMKMCKPWTLQILIILHCLFHEYPVQSSQSESQSRCRSGRLRTLSHKKRLLCQSWHLNPHCQRRHGVNGLDFFCLGWGGTGLEHLMICWFYVRSQGCRFVPKKTFSETNSPPQTDRTKPHLNWFPVNLPPWKWGDLVTVLTGEGSQYASLEVPLESFTVGMPKVGKKKSPVTLEMVTSFSSVHLYSFSCSSTVSVKSSTWQ